MIDKSIFASDFPSRNGCHQTDPKAPSWQRIIYQGAKLDKKIQLSAYSAIFLQILHYFIKVLPIFTDRTFVISLRF